MNIDFDKDNLKKKLATLHIPSYYNTKKQPDKSITN